MRRLTLLLAMALVSIASIEAGAQSGVIHDLGDPRTKSPTPNCANSRFYIDDSTSKLYMSAQGSPCLWTDATVQATSFPGVTADGLTPGGISAAGQVAAQKISQTTYTPNLYYSYGDSITAGLNVTSSQFSYPNRIGQNLGIIVTQRGVSGDMVCDVPFRMLNVDSPAVASTQPLRTLMIGTNEINKGTGAYEAVSHLCFQAVVSWATVPVTSKVLGSAATTTGTCANDTTFAAATGVACTAPGSTQSYTVTTTGGPIYAWRRIIDSDAGTYNMQVDGGTAIPLATATTPAIATTNGHTSSLALVRVTNVAAGTHTVLFTQTGSSGTMSTIAVGTPSNAIFSSLPYLVQGEIPPQLNGGNAAALAAYRADQASDITTLLSDGLNIATAPVTKYLQATTAAADMFDSLHPNDAGHLELAAAFQSVINLRGAGGQKSPCKNVANYTVLQGDQFPGTVLCSGNGTVTLPNAGIADGTVIEIVNLDPSNPTTLSWSSSFFMPSKIYPGGSVQAQFTAATNWSPLAQNSSRTFASSSIGGSALTAGQCASTTVGTTFGVGTSSVPVASPTTYPGDGFYWVSYMSAANTITVKVCAAAAGTPTASTYQVRLLP